MGANFITINFYPTMLAFMITVLVTALIAFEP
jgi:hypothetical protein